MLTEERLMASTKIVEKEGLEPDYTCVLQLKGWLLRPWL